MKIVFTADIHWGYSEITFGVWYNTINSIIEFNPDVFVIGGDIAVTPKMFNHALNTFSSIPCKNKYYVLGNHDIWIYGEIESSWEKYNMFKDIGNSHGFKCLDNGPDIVGNCGIIGNMGWYDYSFRDKKIDFIYSNTIESYKKKKFPGCGTEWKDGTYAKWNKSDEEMAIYFSKLLESHVIEINKKVDSICYFSHHPPMQVLVPYGDLNWNKGNAFQGSVLFEDIIFKYDKIRHIFCGHSHKEIYREIDDKKCYNVGAGYDFPKYIMVEI